MLGLEGKTAFVFGVAAKTPSLGRFASNWPPQAPPHLGYQKRFMSRVFKLKDELPAIGGFYPLDVASDATTQEFFTAFAAEHPGKKADILIHAIGFAPRSCFDRPILFVEDDDINTAMTISANSLQRCLKHALPYLNPGSSTITLAVRPQIGLSQATASCQWPKQPLRCWTRELACHLGPEGHRVSAISSGPIRTIAASGIGF